MGPEGAMACTKEELKKRVEATVVASNGRLQFSPELRSDILAYSVELEAQGRSRAEIAMELGMNGWTLSRWHQNEAKVVHEGRAGFVEVGRKRRGRPPKPKATIEVSSQGFEVTCPSGYEVRVPAGFDGGSLRQLLQALEGR